MLGLAGLGHWLGTSGAQGRDSRAAENRVQMLSSQRANIVTSMPSGRIAFIVVAFAAFVFCHAVRAQAPLPDLRVEATDGASVLHVANRHTQPLPAFLVELVEVSALRESKPAL